MVSGSAGRRMSVLMKMEAGKLASQRCVRGNTSLRGETRDLGIYRIEVFC